MQWARRYFFATISTATLLLYVTWEIAWNQRLEDAVEFSLLSADGEEIDVLNGTDHVQTNYFLWSQKPNNVTWSETVKMCDFLFDRRTNGSDFDRIRDWKIPYPQNDSSIASLINNCSTLKKFVSFKSTPSSRAELDFPLAYVLVGAKSAAQTLRLFRMIYQPQNAYCICYDNKSNDDYKTVMRQLPTCFSRNVFLTPSPENIYWGHYSILRSVMSCMKVLLEKSTETKWKYVQILSWNDFPLKSNAQLVRIFQILNGSQDSALDPMRPNFFVIDYTISSGSMYAASSTTKRIVPDGLTMYKSSFATSMSKEFVDFLFANPTSVRLYEWLNSSNCAEELYWGTVVHNLHLNAPGSFPGQCFYFYDQRNSFKPYISRYQLWQGWFGNPEDCKGKYVSTSCVYGVEDVAAMVDRPELVAHKIYDDFEPAALFCLEHWFWNRSNHQVDNFNGSYYKNLPSVKYHEMENKNDFVC